MSTLDNYVHKDKYLYVYAYWFEYAYMHTDLHVCVNVHNISK